MFLIFQTCCLLKRKFSVRFYHCLSQTTYRNVQGEISHLTFLNDCLPLPKDCTEAMSFSSSTKRNLTISNICYRKIYFTEDCVTHNRRIFKCEIKDFYRNITTSATINKNKTIESDITKGSNVSPSIPTNSILLSNNRIYGSNNSTSDTTETNKTFNSYNTKSNTNKSLAFNNRKSNCSKSSTPTTTTTAAGPDRRHDGDEKLKVEFQQLEECLAASLDRTRLSAHDWLVHEAHAKALISRHFTYDDPATGHRVMTRLCHFLRGKCCGNACRHCVFNHENVLESVRQRRVFNSSFWVDGEPRLLQQHHSTTCGWGPLRQQQQAEDDIEHDLLFKH